MYNRQVFYTNGAILSGYYRNALLKWLKISRLNERSFYLKTVCNFIAFSR